MRSLRRPLPDPRRPRRGMALLLALVMVALISAFITEFNYSARVQILSASHARDDARAYYLAKGGLRLYELVLLVGNTIGSNPMIGGFLAGMGMDLDGPAMVCRSIPFLDTAMVRFLAGSGGSIGEDDEGALLGLLGIGGGGGGPQRGAIDETEADGPVIRRSLLDFDGDFKIECSDESAKIDLNGFGRTQWMALPIQQHPTAALLYGLLAPPEYDPLFEDRLKIDRWELIGNIRDWVDADTVRSGNFGGDEDAEYDDFEPRYRAKNAPFDTLDELRLVSKVDDEVFETFSPAVTIWPKNNKINVNAANPTTIRALIAAFADPTLVSPLQLDQAMPAILFSIKFLPGPCRNAADFIRRVQAQGIAIRPDMQSTMTNMITTKSKVFRLTASGYVGDSVRTITETVSVGRTSTKTLEWRER